MNFLIWLFKLAVVPLTMAQESNNLPLLIEVILELFENSTCPGIVLSIPDDDEVRTERENVMLNELGNRFKRPVTWLTREWPKRREIVCNDAVILFRDQKTQLLSLYRQLRSCFYVNKVIVVINKRQTNSRSSSNSLLEELKNERIFMLIESSNSLEISKWSVNQDRIHHLLYRNNKSLSSDDLSLKLSGRHLKVATLHHPPAVVIRPLNNSSEVGNCGSQRCSVVEGIEPSIMKLIADQLNFTFDYVVAPANEMWGDVVTTATDQQQDRDHKQLTAAAGNNQTSVVSIARFTGIKGMLVRKEVDLAFGDMYMTPLWLSYIGFSQIYKMDYDSFVVPSPKPLANWMALILPFSLKTWLATLASLVLVTAALAARFIRNRSVIESSFLFALGQLLWIQQPRFPDGKSSTGSLFLIWSWLFAATILSSVYRSALISFLTHPYAQQPINSIQQLVESPLNKIMFSDFYKIILLNSTDPYRRQLGHQLKTTDNMSQMLDLLKTGKWAVDSSLDSLNYLMNDDDERGLKTGPLGHRDLHIMQEKLFPTRSSFGLQKDSPLKSRVDLVLQRLIEGGLVDYHRSYLNKPASAGRRLPSSTGAMEQQQRRRNNKKITLIHFSLTNLQGALYLLGIGVFVSTMAFALEFIISIFPSSSGRKTPSHLLLKQTI